MRTRQCIAKQPDFVKKSTVLFGAGACFLVLLALYFGKLRWTSTGANSARGFKISAPPASIHPKLLVNYGKLPLRFEASYGQPFSRQGFISHGLGYGLILTGDEMVLKLGGNALGPRRRIASLIARPQLSTFNGLLPVAPNVGPATPVLGPKGRDVAPRLSESVIRLRLMGANPNVQLVGERALPGKTNYFFSHDRKRWRTKVPTYSRVRYRHVYPGIDLVYYGNEGGQLEHDFVVAPGADPRSIVLAIDVRHELGTRQGAEGRGGLQIDSNGDLVVLSESGKYVRLGRPVVYQEEDGGDAGQVSGHSTPNRGYAIGSRKLLGSRFVLLDESRVGFEVPAYDRTRPLVIDPVLIFSTFLGGSLRDSATGVAVDSSGSAYVTGLTSSSDFPTVNSIEPGPGVFVAKLNPTGEALEYSTFLGPAGSSENQNVAIAVDAAGNAYVTGTAGAPDFPVTPGAFQTTWPGGAPAFVSKLRSDGSALAYSTLLGGSSGEYGAGIAVDSSGSAYVTGLTLSKDFPTVNPIQTGPGFYVSKLNPAGSSLVYSTALEGSGLGPPVGRDSSGPSAIAVDSTGSAYVVGSTNATNFPVTPGAFQTTISPPCSYYPDFNHPQYCEDVVVFKLNAGGSALVYSTYLGGTGNDYGSSIAVDSSQNAYVTGGTVSSDFPTINAFQATNDAPPFGTAFIAKLNANGSGLVYSTYLGGSSYDWGNGIAVDSSGSAYVTGLTFSRDFPTVSPVQSGCEGLYWNQAGFVTKLNAAGSALLYSTYLGCSDYVLYQSNGTNSSAIAVDSSGNAYVAGSTGAPDFLVANPLQAGLLSSFSNAFVAKISSSSTGPWVSLSSLSLPFGAQNVNTASPPLTETVRNGGAADLRISAATIEGSDNGDYAVSADTCTGATVAPNHTCTVGVTFSPPAAGLSSAALSLSDNAANSPQTVVLTGNGGATAPVAVVSPSSVDFGGQPAVYSAASLPVTLSNTGNAPLIITNIMTSPTQPVIGPVFPEDDQCRSGVAAGGFCTITVKISPPSAGPVSGTLTIIDNSNGIVGRTQTVALRGTGQDFTLGVAPGSPGSATIAPGQTATYTLRVVGLYGFNQSVSLSCGALTNVTCTFSPNPVTVGGSATNITLTVTTTAPSASGPPLIPFPPLLFGWWILLTVALELAMTAWLFSRRHQRGSNARWRLALAPLTPGLLLALALAGCRSGTGGGAGGTDPVSVPPSGTSPGSYSLEVEGSSYSGLEQVTLSHQVTLMLTVS